MSLSEILKTRIIKHGPITLAEYMDAALLHPEFGYYTTQMPFGREGDFITAPEISQIFGELIGLWTAQTWQAQGSPHALLMELGPGRGTLMNDILRTTRRVPGFHAGIQVHLVEASPKLAALQKQALAGAHPHLFWHDMIPSLPPKPLFFVANEWFDALPIRQFADGKERKIEWVEGEQFRFTLPAEHITETHETAIHALAPLARHIARHGGAGLIIDYGYAGPSRGDTLQALKAHRFHDPLLAPGSADITAHVPFTLLTQAAGKEGARALGPVPQGAWLKRLGAELRAAQLVKANPAQAETVLSGLARLVSPQEMGELFKVLAVLPPTYAHADGF